MQNYIFFPTFWNAPLNSSVAASGGSGGFTYEWEYSTNNSNWTPIGSSNSLIYAPTGALSTTTYYHRKVTNDCGSVYSNPITVTVTQPVTLGTLSYNSGNPICITSGTVNPSWNTPPATGTYSVSPSGLAISTSTGVITPAGSTKGTYTVTYTVAAAGGCSAVTKTANITVADVPTVATPATPAAICAGSNLSMTAPTVNYNGSAAVSPAASWQLGNTAGTENSFSDVDLSSLTFTTADNNKKLRYRATNGCGNGYSNAVTVTVTTLPVLGTLSYNNPVCIGTPASPSWTVTPTGGSYSISAATGLSINQNTGVVTAATGTATGAYTVTYTVAAAGGCPAVTQTATITVATVPTVNAITTPAAICAGSMLSMTPPTVNYNGSAAVSPVASWQLGNTAGDESSFSDIDLSTHTFTSADNGKKLRYRATNGCGNGYSNAVTVTVNPLPVVTITPDRDSVCAGETLDLDYTSVPNGTTVVWSSNHSGIASVNGNTGEVTGQQEGTATITCTVTTAAGCESAATRVIKVKPKPTVAITGQSAVCAGSTIGLGYNSTVPAQSVAWSSSDTDKATVDSNGTVTGVSAGTTTITCTVTTASGCTGSITKDITVNPKPTVTITTARDSVCVNSILPLGYISGPDGTVVWSSSDTGKATVDSNGTVTGVSAGTVTITCTVTTTAGCEGSATKVIRVNPLPTVTITPTQQNSVCAGSSLQLYYISTVPAQSVAWSSSDTNVATVNGNGQVIGVTAGTVTITCTVTTAAGCVDMGFLSVNVNPLATDNLIDIDNDTICAGTQKILTPGTTGSIALPHVFKWYSSQNALSPFHTGPSYTTSALTADTTFYISVSGNNYCENASGNRKEVKVKVHPLPNAPTATNDTVCYDELPHTAGATAGSGEEIVWYAGATGTAPATAPSRTEAGTTTAYAAARNTTTGCESATRTKVTVTVIALPDAPAANDVTACYDGASHTAGATPTGAGEEIVWYADATGPATVTAPSRTETGTTTAYAAAINADGCESATRTKVTVTVNPNPDYPDIRVEVCAGSSNINLSKYIDTVGSPALSWTGYSIDPATGVIASIPSNGGTYTYIYRVSTACLAAVDRKVYLHAVKNNKIFFPRDTIYVCYEQAEALQMNQIFGVEAEGTWSTNPDLMNNPAYIRQSTAPSNAGAVVFNGKAAYEASGLLPTTTYQGNPAQAIEFSYTVADGCLGGTYEIVIILYEQL